MNLVTIFIISIFTSISAVSHASTEPSVSMNTSYYSINGKSEDEIRNNLNKKTPIFENGRKFDAYTEWFVNWNFWWRKSSRSCAITKVKTRINIRQTFPKLKTNLPISGSLDIKWKKYMKSLLEHENGHKSLGLKAANEIKKRISNMSARSTCKKLEADANKIGNNILNKYKNLETRYDHRTNHGTNEGAIFP